MDVDELDGGETWPLNLKDNRKTQVAEFFCNLLLSVAFFATVVAIFFFTVGAYLEGVAVKQNTDRVVEEMMAPLAGVIPDEQKITINEALKGLQVPDMTSANEEVKKSNNKITTDALLVVGSVLVFGLIVVLSTWGGMRLANKRNPNNAPPFDLKHLFITNGILLGFVLLVEFLFLFTIGVNFRSVDVNDIKKTTAKSLINFLKDD
jgi:hypothetical protein